METMVKANAKSLYWTAVAVMAASAGVDALLLSSVIFSQGFLVSSAFLGLGLFLYNKSVVELDSVVKRGNFVEEGPDLPKESSRTIPVITRP
jgi:hypothetical protein